MGLKLYKEHKKFYFDLLGKYGKNTLSYKKLEQAIQFYGKHDDCNLERSWRGFDRGIEKGLSTKGLE